MDREIFPIRFFSFVSCLILAAILVLALLTAASGTGPSRFPKFSQGVWRSRQWKIRCAAQWNRDDGGTLIVLDEETLAPIRVEEPQPDPEWRRAITKPESDFQVKPIPSLRRTGGPMQVDLISDVDGTDVEEAVYYLRREHAGTNRDRAVPKPWPKPTMLRVYKISREK